MYLPCELIARRLLPVFRSCVARELIEKYKFTQVKVAEKLGTTQAAISQYLRLKRGHKGLTEFEDMMPTIQAVASEVASEIASGKSSPEKIALKFCELCLLLQKKKRLTGN
ncbi:transcriptional regulator [Candidatus Bathyarchaeota archaeon]|nr:transcriptional regulator [Candidatus Bathyarchaeota archaeon]